MGAVLGHGGQSLFHGEALVLAQHAAAIRLASHHAIEVLHGVEVRHRRIGGGHRLQAGVAPAAHGIGAGWAVFTQDIDVKLTELVDEDGLRCRDHAEPRHVRDLIRPGEAAVFDAMAMVGTRCAGERPLHGRHTLIDGGVADGMDGELVAFSMIGLCPVVQLLIAVDEEPAVVASAGVGQRHGRRLAAGAAIGEELDRADLEALVALPGHQALGFGLPFDAVGSACERQIGADLEAAAVGSGAIGQVVVELLPEAKPRVGHTGDPTSKENVVGQLQGLHHPLPAERRQGLLDQLLRRLHEKAVRLPGVIPAQLAPFGVGGIGPDPSQGQRPAVGHAHVPTGAGDVDGVIGCHTVQFCRGGMARRCKVEVVVASSQDPLARRGLLRLGADPGKQLFHGRKLGRMQVDLALLQPEEQHVLMAVVDAGHGGAAGQIDTTGFGAGQSFDVRAVAGCQHPITANGQRFGQRLSQTEKDRPPSQNAICFHVLTHSAWAVHRHYCYEHSEAGDQPT